MRHVRMMASRSRLDFWAAAALLILMAVSGGWSLLLDAPTYDETVHLPAGFTYLDRGDFRLNPEHPPLAKMLAALPVWLTGRGRPDYRSRYWTGDGPAVSGSPRTGADQAYFGFEFLNGPVGAWPRRDPMETLVPARMAILAVGLALAMVVYLWALEMWGRGGALAALFLCALSPSVLAHARLVTTDAAAALGFASTLWCFWRFCRRPGWGRAAGTGVVLGAALMVKYSCLLLLPILAILAAMWAAAPWGTDRPLLSRIRLAAATIAGTFLIAWACLWAGYGFRFAASASPEYRLDWTLVRMEPGSGLRAAALRAARDWRLVPEAYVYGLASLMHGMERPAFLNGERSRTGWWSYFPEAFVVKTPPALLLLLPWVVAALAVRSRGRSFDGWYLAVPVAAYALVSVASGFNIGHRHLLPLEPILFVAAGGVAVLASGSLLRAAAAGALLAGYAASYCYATPRYLSYFNFTAGGPEGGWRYLVDSNIDWGQDLLRLRAWMLENRVPVIDLAYFGTADPRALGIDYRKVILVKDFTSDEPPVTPRSGDYLAASVTMLQGACLDSDRIFGDSILRRGLASREDLLRWMAVRDALEAEGRRAPSLPEWVVSVGILTPERRAEVESHQVYSWLGRVRDSMTPIGRAGDSILIYRMP